MQIIRKAFILPLGPPYSYRCLQANETYSFPQKSMAQALLYNYPNQSYSQRVIGGRFGFQY